ncbi:hypothetical protein HNR44_000208 [Geomicrobium halophilum]|uniref:Uncharacterized protein n=1 Tax=Geomicrobium halophilum TaxID=549000 RepID=A0A841PHP0_9BACL|nr:hypothetical protein [Geomicrobium halophilum]MBB6448259.1 hypothetical protein [Geomicrobium halophilum]
MNKEELRKEGIDLLKNLNENKKSSIAMKLAGDCWHRQSGRRRKPLALPYPGIQSGTQK